MEYSFYPVRAIEEQERLMLQGLVQILDYYGVDPTQDLKPDEAVDEKIKGVNNG